MESILNYVKRRIRETPRVEWEPLGARVADNKSLPRKLAYERKRPPIDSVEPLYRHFLREDFGLEGLPHEVHDGNQCAS